jgi:threonine dehydratase
VNSFKIRGAYNMISQLSHEQRAAGIVACSAGNHAQGVAFSAIQLGIDASIIMPTGTPSIKVDAVRKMGGRVVLHGATFDEAAAEAHRLVKVEKRTLIHPFDDPLVIAGACAALARQGGKPAALD